MTEQGDLQRAQTRVTAELVVGYYVVLAGLDFEFPIPLVTLVLGAGFFADGLANGFRRLSDAPHGEGFWAPWRIALAVGWIVVMFGCFVLVNRALDDVLAPGLTSMIAALPAAAVFYGMIWWLWRSAHRRTH